jgi:antitoxin ParD1/3/4
MEGLRLPNIHLTKQMEEYVDGQIKSGAFSNVSEVLRAGLRMMMEDDGARAFYRLKAELEEAVAEAERGDYVVFDPVAFEPRAFRK